MNLSMNDLRTLDEIQAYNPKLANALRRACDVAEVHGPTESEVSEKDAEMRANDARTQARLRGEKVTKPYKLSADACMQITGIKIADLESLIAKYGDRAVGEELESLAREIQSGQKVKSTYGVMAFRLEKKHGKQNTNEQQEMAV